MKKTKRLSARVSDPHLQEIMDWFSIPQQKWIADRSKHKVALKCRQIGWTEVSVAEFVYYAAITPGHTIYFSKQRVTDSARELLGRARDRWIPAFQSVPSLAKALEVVKDSVNEITFANGSKIVAIANDPSRMRGNVGSYLLDEVDFWELSKLEQLPDSLFPTIDNPLNPKCLIRVISTPYVEGRLFQQICESSAAGVGPYKDWSYHYIDVYDAIKAGYPLDAKALKARYSSTPEKFSREYECKWSSTDYYYFNKESVASLVSPFKKPEITKDIKVYAGVDVGQVKDYTVLSIVYRVNSSGKYLAGYQYLIRQVNYETIALEVAKKICDIGIDVVWVDSTNNLAFYDSLVSKTTELAQRNMTKLPTFKANSASNSYNAKQIGQLTELIDKKNISFPEATEHFEFLNNKWTVMDDNVLVEDIQSIIQTQTPNGLPKYIVERTESGHGDAYDAFALALAASKALTGYISY